MTNLDIKISINTLLYYSASLRKTIEEETLLLMIKEFTGYVKSLYLSMIEEAMKTPRYKDGWEPRDELGYREYIGVEPCKEDILTLIEDSLEVLKRGNYYIVQINPRYRYPKSRMPLLRVLRAIEQGTSDFNARPILVKCNRQITYHLRELWRGYLSLKGVI